MLAPTSRMFVRTLFTKFGGGFTRRMKDSFRWHFSEIDTAERAGFFLYTSAVDQVNRELWFKHFGMSDTFFSWFLITELHIWMCQQRVMDDGFPRRGEGVRNALSRNLWVDCDTRSKKLGDIQGKVRHTGIKRLSHHFNQMLFIYDEGLNKDDQVLACALWQGIFDRNEDFIDFHHLRTLVHYVRSNVKLLDDIPLLTLYTPDSLKWNRLEDSIKATSTRTPLFI